MFEITRLNNSLSPLRDLMTAVTHDPFFRVSGSSDDNEGTLAVDVMEEENDFVIRASLPGFAKSDVDVHVENGVLSIKATREETTESTGEKYFRRERRLGSVSRRLALPDMVAGDEARASLENGELTVRIPKAEAARPRQITVQ
jgi:HSP20 family protein